ncbi:phosphatidate cytidylyltransferase [Thermanaeromonas sp. C210]|uniref:phosphatidate cytidylyltransferase n=1 Tax=Thermanaeromonas sp. C210 TaxID=2731925 RepID=UPI00155C1826|nr:phosphatidate cytidylyltransferase [Thermanaeromonas sp. C210]GFN23853.1 phosphatidate cytidylyltransferase [Thermanaeromonas sp. C210]
MLIQRVLVAVVGIPLLIGLAYAGGLWLWVLLTLISFWGLREYYDLLQRMGINPLRVWGQLGGLALLLMVYWGRDFPTFFPQGALFLFLLVFLFAYPRYSLVDTAASYTGLLYVSGSLSHLLLLRFIPEWGFPLLLYSLILTWVNDTAAYLGGRFWGRRKLCPGLSPAKTWEGASSGLVGVVVTGVLVGPRLLPLSPWHLVPLAVLVAAAGQAGDLIESGIKRMAGAKDSGRFLPGHGGILDRFDSLFLVGPVVYYFWRFVT